MNVTEVKAKRGQNEGERVWWHGKVTSKMEGRGWGMHKKGQMVASDAWWMMGEFSEDARGIGCK